MRCRIETGVRALGHAVRDPGHYIGQLGVTAVAIADGEGASDREDAVGAIRATAHDPFRQVVLAFQNVRDSRFSQIIIWLRGVDGILRRLQSSNSAHSAISSASSPAPLGEATAAACAVVAMAAPVSSAAVPRASRPSREGIESV